MSSTSVHPGGDGVEVIVRPNINIRAFFADLEAFDPALAKAIRRRLRTAGQGLIAHMKEVLDEPPPGLVSGVTKETRVTAFKSSRRREGKIFTKREYVTDVKGTGSRGRHVGARDAIKAKLRTQVSTSKTRPGVRIVGSGAPFARSYNTLRFRHPVFGNRAKWIEQAGRPYFSHVIEMHRRELEEQVWNAIDDGLEAMGRR